MKTISPDSFALLCFLALMSRDSLQDYAPDYITEKTEMLRCGYDAFTFLDYQNMARVVRWCKKWNIELPLPVASEWKLQCDCHQEYYEGVLQ